MANFDVLLNERAFERVGVRVCFDENKYGALLDDWVPDAEGLTVKLVPGKLMGKKWLGQLLTSLAYKDEVVDAGGYEEDNTTIGVNCSSDLASTNNTLLHETKHYFDDVTGELEQGVNVMHRNQNLIVGGTALVGFGGALALHVFSSYNPLIAATAAVPSLPLTWRAYWKSPHEVAARNFAESRELVEAYGQIISYQPL